MAKADISKFRELLLTDAEFQDKLKNAAEAYTGEKDEKAIFDNVLTPLAGEYGLSASFEEFKEYMEAGGTAGELSEDELAQVAGGKGSGGFVCAAVGAGFGSTGPMDNCFFLGMGFGACFTEGATY